VALPDGAVLFNDHDKGLVYRLRPAGSRRWWRRWQGKLAGLAPLASDDGALLASGWAADGAPAVFRIGRDGAVAELVRPAGRAFLNGFRASARRALPAGGQRAGDDLGGRCRARHGGALVRAPTMTRRAAESQNPGVNGLKIHGDVLHVTNSDRALLTRIRLTAEDRPAGRRRPSSRTCSATTSPSPRPGTSSWPPIRSTAWCASLRRGRSRCSGGREQGLTGPTAVAFGRGPSSGWLYAVTTGGVFAPPPGGPVPAEVVRLRVGVAGAPVLRG
jgi:hypothetical protein